jgi:hypothetical protein
MVVIDKIGGVGDISAQFRLEKSTAGVMGKLDISNPTASSVPLTGAHFARDGHFRLLR